MATKKSTGTKTNPELIEELSRELERGSSAKKVVFTYPFDANNPEAQKFAGVNGRTYLVKCGVPVEIPENAAKVLQRQIDADRAAILRAHKMAANPQVVDNG